MVTAQPPIPPAYTECVVNAAAYYSVPPLLVVSILMVEGGRVGTVSHNSNGTDDLGPMQINTIHLPEFRAMGVSRDALVNSACVNITAGTLLLSQHLRATPGQPWRGTADYHSKTPIYHQRYLRKTQRAYQRLVRHFTRFAISLRTATLRRSIAIDRELANSE